jgi:malate dehydrogenase (oxaloacetate-decarboxylating)
MKTAAARAIQDLADPDDPARTLVPSAFDRRVAPAVAAAVSAAWAAESGTQDHLVPAIG